MKGVDNRKARFRTVIALIQGNSEPVLFEGIVNGEIMEAPRGNDGFGYDPVFLPEGEVKTFAEATAEEKNALSHRGRATRLLVEYLQKQCQH